MKTLGSAFGVAALLSMLMTPAMADPKPRPSKPASAQMVANKFAGQMQIWKSCKGGMYFGGNWEAVAYCGQHKNSVAVGKWSTAGGKLCYDVTWYFNDKGKLGTKKKSKCEFELVTDKDGQVWHSWESDNEWWRGFPRDKNFSKGNKFKRQIARNRKKLGV